MFPGSAPGDLWEVNTRIVAQPILNLGLIANLNAGNGQANGNDKRTINRYGFDIRTIYKKTN